MPMFDLSGDPMSLIPQDKAGPHGSSFPELTALETEAFLGV